MKKKLLLTNENNTYEENLQILKECMEQCRSCDCVATVRQITETVNNEYHQLDVQQLVFKADSLIRINDSLVYVQLTTSESGNLQRIRQMHETVLKKGTEMFLAGKENDYFLIIDLLKEDERLSIFYTFSLFQPQFFTLEHDTIEIALPIDRMHFFKEQIDRDEIGYAIALDEENENNADYGAGYSGAESYISGEGFLN